MDAVSQEGGIGTTCAVSACAGHHTNVRRALEVSSFEFTGETNRTNFVMGDSNFQDTNLRRTGTPRAAAADTEVPSGAT